MKQRVAIVNAGEWGWLKRGKGDYDAFVGHLERVLKRATRSDKTTAADVKVVESTEQGLLHVQGYGSMVYISRSMIGEAKKVAAEHSHIQVTLFTGSIPDGEVVFASKAWGSTAEQLEEIILR